MSQRGMGRDETSWEAVGVLCVAHGLLLHVADEFLQLPDTLRHLVAPLAQVLDRVLVVAHAALDLADLGAVGLDLRGGRADLRSGFVHLLLPGLVLLGELLRRVLDLMVTRTARALGESKEEISHNN